MYHPQRVAKPTARSPRSLTWIFRLLAAPRKQSHVVKKLHDLRGAFNQPPLYFQGSARKMTFTSG